METYKKNIGAGLQMQWAVGDNRHDAYVSGNYTIARGSLRQSGSVQIGPGGEYSSSFVGADCGITITGHLSGNKLLLKVVADSSDSNGSSVKFNLKKMKL